MEETLKCGAVLCIDVTGMGWQEHRDFDNENTNETGRYDNCSVEKSSFGSEWRSRDLYINAMVRQCYSQSGGNAAVYAYVLHTSGCMIMLWAQWSVCRVSRW